MALTKEEAEALLKIIRETRWMTNSEMLLSIERKIVDELIRAIQEPKGET